MFENVIGHKQQKQTMENLISSNTFSHAYLFVGKTGVGKSLFAKEIAKVLLNTDNLETCIDYKYICKDKDKKDLSVEKIRKELLENVYIAPAMCDRKVYIIDDGEFLNFSSQNALLKTLEEPPRSVNIIIISNTLNTFLPTVLSRINVVNFNGVDKEKVSEYIKVKYNIKLNDNILEFINGSIGFASDIVENNLLDEFEKVEKIYKAILKKDIVNSIILAGDSIFNKKNMLEYLEYLIEKDKMYHLVKFVEKASIRLKNNGNYDIVIDNMIIDMIENL